MALLPATEPITSTSNMKQATLLELLEHVGKLTEVVEKMSTHIVMLNEGLKLTTTKVDQLLARDVPAAALADNRNDEVLRSDMPTPPSTVRSSKDADVIEPTKLPYEAAAQPTKSLTVPRPKRSAPAYEDYPANDASYRPATSKSPSSARFHPDFEESDGSPTVVPPAKRARSCDTATGSSGERPEAASTAFARALGESNSKTKTGARSDSQSKTVGAISSRSVEPRIQKICRATYKETRSDSLAVTRSDATTKSRKKKKRDKRTQRTDPVAQARDVAKLVKWWKKRSRSMNQVDDSKLR